jgi:hypothetical protein
MRDRHSTYILQLEFQERSETTDGRRAAEPQPKERDSVSRSTLATKDARDFSKAWFHVELLRVTDPRSEEFAQPAEVFTDSSTDRHKFFRQKRFTSEVISLRSATPV